MTAHAPALAAIEALLSAATPLPWMQARHIEEPRAIVTEARRMHSLLGLDRDGMAIVDSEADAALIVAAVNGLPALLAALRSLRSLRAHVASEPERVAAAVAAETRRCIDACEHVASQCPVEDDRDLALTCAEAIAVDAPDALAATGGR